MALMFSVSGLRGVVDRDINESIVRFYSAGFVEFTRAKKIVIGRDTRASGSRFRRAVIAGAGSESDIIDLGIVPTPTVLFMVRKLRADCGIVITASHNPEQWNALKFVTRRGRFIDQNEFRRFSRFLTRDRIDAPRPRRRILQYRGAIEEHISDIYLKLHKPRFGFRVGVDAVNGAASRALPLLCEELGCKVIRMNCRYSPKFPRGPEPIRENLDGLASVVRRKRLDLGLACDPDGDRLAVVDESGRPVSEEMTLALAADFVMRLKKGPIVVNQSTTGLMEYIAGKHRQTLYRSKIGEGNVVAMMSKVNAVIGGEGNGGVIYPTMNYCRDALVAAALVLTMLKHTGMSPSELVRTYPSFYMIKKKMKIPLKPLERMMRQIERRIAGRVDRKDGLRIVGQDYWVHVRPSQTEPLIRIIGESPDEAKIKKMVKIVEQIIRQ